MQPAILEHTDSSSTMVNEIPKSPAAPPAKKGWSFWMIMLSLAISCFLSALDLTALSTALPTIAEDLRSENFSWIASSYALSSTVFIPIFAGLAEVFGRKYILLSSIVIFAIGSAVCGSADSMSSMIAGRTVAGIGGGGILASVEIVVADLVPLAERGLFFGILGMVWAISSAIGPVIGGLLADSNWRWLFYLNLPIASLATALVLVFMNLRMPAGTLAEKLKKIDWVGNATFILAATSIILGLTFGGDMFPWASAAVLVPLIGGIILLVAFFWIEKNYVQNPIIPFVLLSNRTTVIGYLETLLHGLVSIMAIYLLPSYMQMRGHDGVQSGIDLFPIAFLIAPVAIVTGITVTVTGHYKIQNILIWVFCAAGAGLLLILDADVSWTAVHGSQTLIGIGLGLGYAATTFPVLAPLPIKTQAAAMGTHGFSRSFGQVLGIAIGSTTFINQLAKKLPAEFASQLPGGPASAFSAIGKIKDLPEPLKAEVQVAFADSLKAVWYVLIGLSVLGLAISFGMKSLPLETTTDENWGIVQGSESKTAEIDVEKAEPAAKQ